MYMESSHTHWNGSRGPVLKNNNYEEKSIPMISL